MRQWHRVKEDVGFDQAEIQLPLSWALSLKVCATTPDPALKGSSQLVLELYEDWSGRWLEQKWRQQSVGSMDTPRVARNPCLASTHRFHVWFFRGYTRAQASSFSRQCSYMTTRWRQNTKDSCLGPHPGNLTDRTHPDFKRQGGHLK